MTWPRHPNRRKYTQQLIVLSSSIMPGANCTRAGFEACITPWPVLTSGLLFCTETRQMWSSIAADLSWDLTSVEFFPRQCIGFKHGDYKTWTDTQRIGIYLTLLFWAFTFASVSHSFLRTQFDSSDSNICLFLALQVILPVYRIFIQQISPDSDSWELFVALLDLWLINIITAWVSASSSTSGKLYQLGEPRRWRRRVQKSMIFKQLVKIPPQKLLHWTLQVAWGLCMFGNETNDQSIFLFYDISLCSINNEAGSKSYPFHFGDFI